MKPFYLTVSLLFCFLVQISLCLTATPMKLNVQVGDTLTFAPFIRGWDTTATNITTTFTQGKLGSVELMPSYFDSNNYMIYYDTNYLNYQGKTAPYPNQKGRHRAPRLFPGFRYIASGTSGIDSFTFKVTTSIDSTLTTTCLIRITPPEPGNMLVLLVVNQVIYPSVQTEVNRLASDLQNEGYKTEIVPFPNLSGTAADGKRLWDTISVRYNNRTQIMAGAILIGKLPTARDGWLADGADGSFWSMTMWASEADSAMLGNRVGVGGYGGGWYTPGHLNIWVSRMGCDPYYTASYGSETVLLKRVLQSNHDYRTGASRLPRTAFFNKIWAPKLLDGNKLSDVWPTVNLRPSTDTTPFHLKEFRMGGEVFDLSAEGNYAYYARPCRITINDFYNSHFPIRFWLSSACHSGNGGGFLNQAAMIKNSGNVLAVGPTQYCGAYGYLGPMFGLADTSAVLPPRVRMRGYLKEGNNFGRAWIRANACIFASMFYGDLSLSPNMTPENQKPVIV
ncbi:MAG: hypothetical protein JNL74_12040, partial [Fibrobacteres bacterium]|nr:hypothetical protein [Fibrobacterota bacterium]